MEYMGIKQGLTSSSTDQAFWDGLDEIRDSYEKSSSYTDKLAVDGVVYDFASWEPINQEKIPGYVWGLFNEELKKQYRYDIGSCFNFTYVNIPYKKALGSVYRIITIVRERDSQGYPARGAFYFLKGDANPKK